MKNVFFVVMLIVNLIAYRINRVEAQVKSSWLKVPSNTMPFGQNVVTGDHVENTTTHITYTITASATAVTTLNTASKIVYLDLSALNVSGKVSKSGDVMSGRLVVQNGLLSDTLKSKYGLKLGYETGNNWQPSLYYRNGEGWYFGVNNSVALGVGINVSAYSGIHFLNNYTDYSTPYTSMYTDYSTGKFVITTKTNAGIYIANRTRITRLTSDSSSVINGAASAYGGVLEFRKSRGSEAVKCSTSDTIGVIKFRGFDGSKYMQSASIISLANGTTATNKIAGSLIFKTSLIATGTASVTNLIMGSNSTTAFTDCVGKFSVGFPEASASAGISYDFSLDGTAARTIGMLNTSSTAGSALSIVAGESEASNGAGGNLLLKSGDGRGTGGSYISLFTSTNGASGATTRVSTEKIRITATGDILLLSATVGVIFLDTNAHYWRQTINTVGVPVYTDLGTSVPN